MTMLKRVSDFVLAICALIVLAPLMGAVAVMIKAESHGPVLHRKYRVGMDGREFKLYKFRTIVANGHKHGPPIIAEDDPRVTQVGRLLRLWKFDELPQLLNVVKGEMSLVGPTPEDPTCVAMYTSEQKRILNFRPGLTGPASIAYRSEYGAIEYGGLSSTYLQTVMPAKLALDLRYFEHRSFWSDIAILGQAMAALFRESHRLRQITTVIRICVPWLVLDSMIVGIGFYAALFLRFVDNINQDLRPYLSILNLSLPALMVVYAVGNHLWRLHRRVWRYASAPEVTAIFVACSTSTAIVGLADLLVGLTHNRPLPVSVVLLGGFFTLTGMVLTRYRWRLADGLWPYRSRHVCTRTRAVIYGAGHSGQVLARRILTEPGGAKHEIIGFIDDDPAKRGLRLHNIPVLGKGDELERIVEDERVDLIILAMANIQGERLRTVVSAAQCTAAQIQIVPDWLESIKQSGHAPLVREVRVDDLLGRHSVVVDGEACSSALSEKIVLVTGGAGSVGSELCRQITAFRPGRLLVLDNNESAVHDLEIELHALCPELEIVSVVGDVTDAAKMEALFSAMRPQVIFHAAAYKHVPLMERYPEEAIRVNVGGTLIMLDTAHSYGAERFVLVSTDKAVNAESVMGATKRLAELLVLHVEEKQNKSPAAAGGLLCTAVRFGNVLGSRGSVVPTFAKQIEIGGPVTVTHRDMTRYFMEISEAAALIIQAAALTKGGEIFMLEMGSRIRVDELARKMIRFRGLRPETDIPIVYVGMRPGEKLHEELTFAEEKRVHTAHPHILRVISQRTEDAPHINRAIQRLVKSVTSGGREQLTQELMTLSQLGSVRAYRSGHRRGPVADNKEWVHGEQTQAEAPASDVATDWTLVEVKSD